MVTVGALQAGSKENVIPDEAVIKLNVRTFDEGVRKRVLTATGRVVEAFRDHFPAARIHETGPASASEDFGSFGAEWGVPSVFWFVGGTDPEMYARAKAENRINELPTNHNPRFLPVLHPTLEAGVEAMVVAAQAWLSA